MPGDRQFIPYHRAAGRQLTPLFFRFKNRPQELGIPFFLLVMFDPETLGILTGNDPGAKDHIPYKEHIPEITFIITHSVLRRIRMMRMMRSGGRDEPLQHPASRIYYLLLIKSF